MMKFFVSRQNYYYSAKKVVEIAIGGIDYANPDMLSPKYGGEGMEYTNPIDAVNAAILIRDSWVSDGGNCAGIAAGCTGGFTAEFEPFETDNEVIQWGKELYDKLPKCSHCSSIVGDETYSDDSLPGEIFCCTHCAQERYYYVYKDETNVTESDEIG